MQKSQIVSIIVAVIGAIIVILAGVLGFVVVPNIIDDKIIEEVRLIEGEETYEKWHDIPIPIYLNFYIMHVTNPDEVENGATPIIEDKGPYAYNETRNKVNVIQDSPDLIKYEEVKTYYFDPAMSCSGCTEDDTYNIINIAFIAVVDGIRDLAGDGLAALLANSVLGSETIIKRNVRVGDLTFNGFDTRLYTNVLGPLLPEEFSGGRFGLYKGQNETTDGVYEIYTGVDKSADFGMIKTWNGSTYVPDSWWQPKTPCGMINGTDGSVFPPFVEKSRRLDLFVTDLCRSLYLVYEKEIEHMGVKGYRFVAPKEMLEDPRINEDNQCFCTEPTLEDCPHAGVLPVKNCRGAPLMMSTPHFYYGTESYYIDGGQTKPVKEDHETYVDLEPHTGLNLRASKKIQVNVEVKRIPGIKAMANLKDYYIFPLVWANEESNMDQTNIDDLKKQLLTPLKIVDISKWTLLGVGCALFGVGSIMFIVFFRRSTQTV